MNVSEIFLINPLDNRKRDSASRPLTSTFALWQRVASSVIDGRKVLPATLNNGICQPRGKFPFPTCWGGRMRWNLPSSFIIRPCDCTTAATWTFYKASSISGPYITYTITSLGLENARMESDRAVTTESYPSTPTRQVWRGVIYLYIPTTIFSLSPVI